MVIISSKSEGTELNFRIIGGTTQPQNPRENDIWVHTETPIGSYQFGSGLDETAGGAFQAGDVWIETALSSAADFNALKKNGIWIAPVRAYQYAADAWEEMEAQIYQNGEWIALS